MNSRHHQCVTLWTNNRNNFRHTKAMKRCLLLFNVVDCVLVFFFFICSLKICWTKRQAQHGADIDRAMNQMYLPKIFIVASNTNQAAIKLISHATRNAFTVPAVFVLSQMREKKHTENRTQLNDHRCLTFFFLHSYFSITVWFLHLIRQTSTWNKERMPHEKVPKNVKEMKTM